MTFESVTDALRRYADELARQGLRDHFADGLTAREIDEIEAEVGFRFSEDVRAVWSWHNGTHETVITLPGGQILIVPDHPFPRFRDAVDRGESMVKTAEILEEGTPGVDRFVQLNAGNDPFFINTTEPDLPDSLTFRSVWGRGINSVPHITVTERVDLWIEAFQSGAWYIDEHRGMQQIDDKLSDKLGALLYYR